MSRSGYSDDLDQNLLNIYRANVDRASYGKRGRKFFRDLVAALDAMPEKKLIRGELEAGGEVCALGSLGRARAVPMKGEDTTDTERMGDLFGIAKCLAAETMYENDERYGETPEQRWERMRKWAFGHLPESRSTVDELESTRAETEGKR